MITVSLCWDTVMPAKLVKTTTLQQFQSLLAVPTNSPTIVNATPKYYEPMHVCVCMCVCVCVRVCVL